MCWLKWRILCHVNSEGFGEYVHLQSLARALVTVPKPHRILPYLCEQTRLWQVSTFAKSSLNLLHSSNISCAGSIGDLIPFCASSEGSGESAHLQRLPLDSIPMPQMAICVLFTPVAKTLVDLHICTGFHEPYSHWTL